MAIEWRDILGWEGLYQISNQGCVRNLKTGSNLKNWDHKGYHRVGLSRDGIRKKVFVHQLVIESFGLPKPSSKHEINHKNGVKIDNRVENLEWVTHSENLKHAYRSGLHNSTGENNGRAKLNVAKVRLIKKRLSEGESCASLAEEFDDVTYTAIWLIANGRNWKSVI